jgi:hypothetical protein
MESLEASASAALEKEKASRCYLDNGQQLDFACHLGYGYE